MEDPEDDLGAAAGDDLIDPTAVVGRRVAGWLVDAAIIGAGALLPLLALGDSYERPGSAVGLDVRRFGSDTGLFFRSTVAVIHDWEWAVAGAVALVMAILLLIVLPGRRGWSPGLLAADLRLVDGDGGHTGVRPSLVRFVGWLVDLLPGVPLVGYGAMRFSRHHQRVGDRLAHSYVVDRAFAGRPPTEAAPLDPDAPAPTVLVDPSLSDEAEEVTSDHALEALPGTSAEQATVRRGVGRRRAAGSPAPADDVDESAGSPEPEHSASDAWSPDGPGVGDQEVEPAASAAGDREAPRPGPPEGVVPDQPVWDRDEERYEMWHSSSGQWVVYDDTEGSWRPR